MTSSLPPIPSQGTAVDEAIQRHYSSRWDEAGRLSSTIKGQLESARLYEFLAEWFPEVPARVADIGGGPGAHARWLCEMGYQLDLIDPVQSHVRDAKAAGIKARVGDARRLPWANDVFDAVLMAGPLYHLPDAPDRHVALREAMRVLKPGGVIAAIAISRADKLIGSAIANTRVGRYPIVTEILEDGYSENNERLAHCYYHREAQLRTELAEAGLRAVDIFGLTGSGGWLTVMIDAHFKEQPYSENLALHDPLSTALACTRLADRMPELVASSSLFVAIGRKD